MKATLLFSLAFVAQTANAIVPVTDTCPSDGQWGHSRKGACHTDGGKDQNMGVIRLQPGAFRTEAERQMCLDMCACVHGVTACEIIVDRNYDGCFAHTQPVTGSLWKRKTAHHHSCFLHVEPDDGVCEGTFARMQGDPYCHTFDGIGYGCHGQGDLILSTSRLEDDPLMIQARSITGPWHDWATTAKSAAFQVSTNVPAIVASVPTGVGNTGGCPWTFTVGDITVNEDNIHTYMADNFAGEDVRGYAYGTNAVFMFPERKARIDLQVVESDTYGCQLGILICLTPDKHGGGDNIVGHLGSPNGNQNDDFQPLDESLPPIPVPTKGSKTPDGTDARLAVGTQWGVDNWCVFHKEDSLLDQSEFDQYAKCHDQLTLPPPTEVAACKEACCADPSDEETCKNGPLADCYIAGGPDGETCVDQGGILDALNAIPEEIFETFSANEDPDLVLPPPSICVMEDLFVSNSECPERPVAELQAYNGDKTAPPENIFYDFNFTDSGEKVAFKIWHDIGQADALDLDVYVQYKRHIHSTESKAGNWHCARFDLECTPTDTDPTTPDEINAVCTAGIPNSYTVVTVAYVLKGTNDLGLSSSGGPVEECCYADTTGFPVRRYTYVINCGCPTSDARLLRGKEVDLVAEFMANLE